MSRFKVGDRVVRTSERMEDIFDEDSDVDWDQIQDSDRIPPGTTGTITYVYSSPDWIQVNWDNKFDFMYFDREGGQNIWCVIPECLEFAGPQPTKEELVIKKITFLNERKQLDKSRIVPPKGIYRGSKPLPIQETPNRSETNSIPRTTFTIDPARYTDAAIRFERAYMEQLRSVREYPDIVSRARTSPSYRLDTNIDEYYNRYFTTTTTEASQQRNSSGSTISVRRPWERSETSRPNPEAVERARAFLRRIDF